MGRGSMISPPLLEELNARGLWIDTFTGKQFFFTDPRPEDVDLRDIAHSLSRLARFVGHVDGEELWTVGHHVLMCSELARDVREHAPDPTVWRNLPLYCLLHDFHEAYIGDIAAPVKMKLRSLPGVDEWWRDMEHRLDEAIYSAFHVPMPTPEQLRLVKAIDNLAMVLEGREVLPKEVSYREIFVDRVKQALPWMLDPDLYSERFWKISEFDREMVERSIRFKVRQLAGPFVRRARLRRND